MNNMELDIFNEYEEDEELFEEDVKIFNITHKTKDGKLMYLKDMDNDHLKNTINLFIRKLEAAKQVILSNDDKFKREFYKTKSTNERAKRDIEIFNLFIYKYIAESAIRAINIDGELEKIRLLLDRKTNNEVSVNNLDLENI